MVKTARLWMISLGIATIIAAIATGQQQIAIADEQDLDLVEVHLGELNLVEILEALLGELELDEDLKDFIEENVKGSCPKPPPPPPPSQGPATVIPVTSIC